MKHPHAVADRRRKPVSLTVREDIIKTARQLGLNTSQAAEAGIDAAVRQAQASAWRAENKEAIDAYNKTIATEGLPLTPIWQGSR